LICSGVGCVWLGLLFLIMTGLHPYTWGLPPQWLPAKWNPCPQEYRDYFPGSDQSSILRQQICQRPPGSCKPCRHRRGCLDGAHDSTKVVVRKVQCKGGSQILPFLACAPPSTLLQVVHGVTK
jgi:hypothetical protein